MVLQRCVPLLLSSGWHPSHPPQLAVCRAVPKGDIWLPRCGWLIVLLPRIQTTQNNFLASAFSEEGGCGARACVCIYTMSLETFKIEFHLHTHTDTSEERHQLTKY